MPTGIPTASAYITQLILTPTPPFTQARVAHADIEVGGSTVAGETTSAFAGSNNHDKPPTPVGALPDTAVTFNRLGAFFQDKYSAAARRLMNGLPQDKKVDRYKGGTQPAQLTIALHELAHLLEKIGPGHVPGFVPDGADPLRKLSEQNTRLLLSKCRLMIERTP